MKKYVKNYAKTIKEVYKCSKIGFILYVSTSLALGLLTTLPIFLLQKIFDGVLEDVSRVWFWVVAFMIVKISASIVQALTFSVFSYYGEVFDYKFKRKLTNCKLNTLDFEDKKILDSMEKSLENSSLIFGFLDSLVYPLTDNIPALLLVSIYIWNVKPSLVFVLILMFLPAVINQILGDKDYKELEKVVTSEDRRVKSYYEYVSSLKNFKETRILNASGSFLSKIKFSLENKTLANMKVAKKRNLNDFITQFVSTCGFALLTYMMFVSLIRGEISIGFFSAIYLSMYSLYEKMCTMAYFILKVATESVVKVENYFNFLDKISKSDQKEQVTNLENIQLKNVNFKYPNAKDFSLKDINLTINKGEVVVIVGENGSGKSTLTKLILSLYVQTSGEVRYNDKRGSISSVSSAVFQDFSKYALDLNENIALASLIDIEKLDNAKKTARLNVKTDEILSKEFGGTDLSGGLWQKIAIARAIYKNSEIIVLDEPTSAIDAEEEANLYNIFESLKQEKTVIIVTHRMGTVKFADKVLVMEDGKLVANGTHENLLETSASYTNLWNAQAVQYGT